MSAKHTPAPWHVEDPLGPDILSIVSGGPEVYQWKHIAQIGTEPCEDDEAYGTLITPDEAAANARLIAGAPDLLTALQDAYRFISQPRTMWNDKAEYDTRNYNALTAKIRAAISKAEGSGK